MNFIKSEGLFWLTVLEVPAQDWTVPLLCASDGGCTSWRSTWWNKTLHIKIQETKSGGEMGLMIQGPPARPKDPTHPSNATLVTKHLTRGTWCAWKVI
jgi:hypothetical protein